jgi:hypothetical protein
MSKISAVFMRPHEPPVLVDRGLGGFGWSGREPHLNQPLIAERGTSDMQRPKREGRICEGNGMRS